MSVNFFNKKILSLIVGSSLASVSFLSVAQNDPLTLPYQMQNNILPPPYQITGANHVFVDVVWNEVDVRKSLPPGIKPVKGMTGGINIYQVDKGYYVGAYQSVYYWVDIEGFDSPEGIKGRWILAGAFGPNDRIATTLKKYYGVPAVVGTSRFESISQGKRAIGTLDGKDFIAVEIKSDPNPCVPVAIRLNYIGLPTKTNHFVMNEIPYLGEGCKAEVMSVNVTTLKGNPFGKFSIEKVVGASEVKNGALSFSYPKRIDK